MADVDGVRDEPGEGRFVVERDGATAELVYEVRDDKLILVHTGVPDALGGQGVGGELVQAAIRRAAANGMVIVPWCPFARGWLERHPDAASGVDIDWETRPSG